MSAPTWQALRDELVKTLDHNPDLGELIVEDMINTPGALWQGIPVAVVGDLVLSRKPGLADLFFDGLNDRLSEQDLDLILSGQNDVITPGMIKALMKAGVCKNKSSSMAEGLLGFILMEGERIREAGLLDTLLDEADFSTLQCAGLRGRGNAHYLAADHLIFTNPSSDLATFVFTRISQAGCDPNAPCRHQIRKNQFYDFDNALGVACAYLDLDTYSPKPVIDGLLSAGADPGTLLRTSLPSGKYLRQHPVVRARRMSKALGWIAARRGAKTSDRPWRGM